MINPYESPVAKTHGTTNALLYRFAVGSIVAVVVWTIFVVCAAVLGANASFHTGKTEELPKWNGWSYLFFSVKEFAVMGAILTWPIAVLVGLVASAFAAGRTARYQRHPV